MRATKSMALSANKAQAEVIGELRVRIASLESSLREAEVALQGRTVSCVCGGRDPVAAPPDAGKAGEREE